MKLPVKIFIGYDEPYPEAYEVTKQSILKLAGGKYDLEIIPINYNTVKDYRRSDKGDVTKESTQFTYARFWTPYESNFEGFSIFVDGDFLFLDNIDELIDLYDEKYAVMCCKHDYTPTEHSKMDGKIQTNYPRKCWSSLIIFNNSHPKNKTLEPWVLNDLSPAYLHRFMWLADRDIGEIPVEWNWLVGWYKEKSNFRPKAYHFTEGGPWNKSSSAVQYRPQFLPKEFKRWIEFYDSIQQK